MDQLTLSYQSALHDSMTAPTPQERPAYFQFTSFVSPTRLNTQSSVQFPIIFAFTPNRSGGDLRKNPDPISLYEKNKTQYTQSSLP